MPAPSSRCSPGGARSQPHGSTPRALRRGRPGSTPPGLAGAPGPRGRATRRRAHTAGGCRPRWRATGLAGAPLTTPGLAGKHRWRLRAQRRRVTGSLAQRRRVTGSAAPSCRPSGAWLVALRRRVTDPAALGCGPSSARYWLCDAGLRPLRRGIRDGASGFTNSPPYKQNPPTQGGKTSPLVSLGVAGDSFGVFRVGLWMSRANVDNSKNRARTAESPRARGRNAGAGGISTGADRGVSARKL